MAQILDLPEEVLTRVFGTVLRCPWNGAPGEFGYRAARRAKDALALAFSSRRLWETFGSCLISMNICTPELPPSDLHSLLKISGPHLRSLTLGQWLSASFTSAPGTTLLFQILRRYNFNLVSLSLCAVSVCIQYGADIDLIQPFRTVCERLTDFKALKCTSGDMSTIAEADFSRLRSLEVSVDNSYECDVQLCKLWSSLGEGLRSLSLHIWSYDGSRVNAQGEIVGDGLENFRLLRAKNLQLRQVELGRLPIRALILAHTLLTEPPNSALRVVVLRNTHVWPFFMGKLSKIPTVREIHVEKCRVDSQDVPLVLKESGPLLRTFWANVGHWTLPSQLAVLSECPNLERADLHCRYERAQEDVLNYCYRYGKGITSVRVGGLGFEAEDVFKIVRHLPNMTALSICTAPLNADDIETLFKTMGTQLFELEFDHVAGGLSAVDLFKLIQLHAPQLRKLSVPFTKLISNIPVDPGMSARAAAKARVGKCAYLLDKLEEQVAHLDIESLRMCVCHNLTLMYP